MKVDIYIHGVPNGQRIWGTGGDDQIINQFYGAGGEEQTRFLAEARKSGGQNYCYYSILKYKNVIAENGRAGSYFGLTIRMDMVCTKVKAMFQILDMIYNNAISGKFLKKDGERLQYIVSDFKEKENLCKSIIGKLMTMLDQSVDANDFVNITPSMLNGRNTPKLNIAEYTSETAFASINQNGGIAVSSEYPSVQLSTYIKKKDAEVNAIKLQSQQDISRIQQKASQDLQEQERKSNAALQQTQQQAQREIEQTKAKYSDVDRKLQAYDQQVKQMDRSTRELQSKIKQLQKTVEERDHTIKKLGNTSHGNPSYNTTMRTSGFIEKLATQVLPFVNLLIVITVLVAMCFIMPSDNSKKVEQISVDLTEIKNKLTSAEGADNKNLDLDSNKRKTVKRIDSECGSKIKLNISNIVKALDEEGKVVTGGKWSCDNDANITDNGDGTAKITASQKVDSVTVYYILAGKSYSRVLYVKK